MSGYQSDGASRALSGKHVLVTGGTRGIGAAITYVLLAHGARVTMLGRSPKPATEMIVALNQAGEVWYTQADVADPITLVRAFDDARARSGPVEILVNNAGQASSAPLNKTDAKLWERMIAVNLSGTFHCIQAALPGMLDAGWVRIVNIASTAGLIGYAYVSAYCAAKHGVAGLTRALALEVAAKGVTVNAVCPGYTATGLMNEAVANIVAKTGRAPEEAREQLASRNPQKRLVRPEEVANAAAWLCLPGSEAITGQAIAVAGAR
ncbi:MAG: SDR family NAD(P)-dependent oxidoreductase [Bryobacteraceae bacterium]